MKKTAARNKADGGLGILPDPDRKAMLEAFPKMSPHDQAAIFMLIKTRATASQSNKSKAGGAAS
jgi:hypothetical protein